MMHELYAVHRETSTMKTIRGKMLIRFGGVLSALLIVLGLLIYREARDSVFPLTKSYSEEVLTARSDEMGRLIGGYLRDVKAAAARAETCRGDSDAILRELGAFTEVTAGGDYEMFFFADVAGDFITPAGATGNVADREYFKAVVQGDADGFISEPLVSRATSNDVFVVARAVRNERGERIGMVGATVQLETLTGIAAEIRIGKKGFGYVVGRDGLLIAHPSKEWRLKLNLLDSAAYGFVDLDKVGRMMINGESGFATYLRPDGSRYVAIFHTIRNTPGWCLGLALSEDELMKPARALTRTVLYLMALIVVIVLLVVGVVSGGIAAPILALCRGVQHVGAGHLDKPLDIRTGDEIEALAAAFNKMQVDLVSHIETLRRTTAEKERIERDLHVANKIQTSMLPRIFPPFPDIDTLDLYATMEPAKEVGGDFYDFFLIDDNHLCFSIGDVSGKGVPAALFMVITRTILKNQALLGKPLSEIMSRTNDMLCEENEESMFVTVFMGVLNIQTGDLEYVCAGHNPPLIARGGGSFEYLKVTTCRVVGGYEHTEYPSLRTTLASGDLLFLYTDGVTEAMNESDELFGDKRMFSAVNGVAERNARSVIGAARAAVNDFVRGTPASDDVTMLALGRIPGKNL